MPRASGCCTSKKARFVGDAMRRLVREGEVLSDRVDAVLID
jgi:hypothetical protein